MQEGVKIYNYTVHAVEAAHCWIWRFPGITRFLQIKFKKYCTPPKKKTNAILQPYLIMSATSL